MNTTQVFELFRLLFEKGYTSLSGIPTMKRPLWKFFLEPPVFLRFIRGKTDPFCPTILPDLYSRWSLHNRPELKTLFKLFLLNRPVKHEAASAALNGLHKELIDSGLLIDSQEGMVISRKRFIPWSDRIFVCDPEEGSGRQTMNYVYIGGDSTLLSRFAFRHFGNRSWHRLLDICAGTGFQGILMADNAEEILCTEYNPRAVELAEVNIAANGLADQCSVIQSDLYSGIEGRFDLIICNPPYNPMPESKRNGKVMDACGGDDHGMQIPLAIIGNLAEYLTEDGRAAVLAASPVIDGEDRLYSRLVRIASDKGLGFIMHPLKYCNINLDREYQAQERISHMIFYLIEARIDKSGKVLKSPYPVLRKAMELLYTKIS
jgi:SAM-dependent methyltransferase